MIVINNLKKLIGLRIIVKLSLIIFLTTNLVLINSLNAQAIGSSQTPQSGSLGLVANIPSPSPSIIPTISTPSNGSTISSQQIQVSGLCQSGLLVKVYSNNIFVGSTNCSSGSYSLNIDLFNGQNSLTVTDFNTLGQNSPSSSLANINYSSPTATAGLDQLNLTSKITELGASPNQKLVWPIVISNGIAPYALSINWGDSSNPSVVSQPVSGLFNIVHSYSTAGIYNITISAGDSKGAGAFLQLVSVIGSPTTQVQSTASKQLIKSNTSTPLSGNNLTGKLTSLTIVVFFVGLLITFYLGSKHGQKATLRKYR